MVTKERERKAAPARKPSGSAAKSAGRKKTTTGTAGRNTSRRAPQRTQKQEPVRVSPDVVYLPPKPFDRNRLLLRLATVVGIVLALTLSLALFFRVKVVEVSGMSKYTAYQILEASGIKVESDDSKNPVTGDGLLTFSRAQAVAKIQAALPYVDDVRIGIKLPDTVKIDIVEIEVTYAVKAQDDGWWLISAGGKVVEKAAEGAEEGYTKILGVQLASPQAGERAVALESSTAETDADGNPIPVTVTEAQRLQTALNIAEYLEMNGIIGKAASVDVNDLGDIQIWYGQQYQVKLGDETQLSYKISWMRKAIEQLADYQSGVLDISLTVKTDGVIFSSFD